MEWISLVLPEQLMQKLLELRHLDRERRGMNASHFTSHIDRCDNCDARKTSLLLRRADLISGGHPCLCLDLANRKDCLVNEDYILFLFLDEFNYVRKYRKFALLDVFLL